MPAVNLLLRKARRKDFLLVPVEVASVGPERVGDSTCGGDSRVAAEADHVAVCIDPRVLPEDLGARRVAGRTQRLRPRAPIAGVCAGEPRLLSAGIAAGVVETGPEQTGLRVCNGRWPEPVCAGVDRPDRASPDPPQRGIEDT